MFEEEEEEREEREDGCVNVSCDENREGSTWLIFKRGWLVCDERHAV